MKYCGLSQGSVNERGEYEGSLMTRRKKKQPGFMPGFVGDKGESRVSSVDSWQHRLLTANESIFAPHLSLSFH